MKENCQTVLGLGPQKFLPQNRILCSFWNAQHASIQRKVYLVDSSNGRLLWTGRFEQLPSEETRFKMTESDGLIELVYKEVDGQGDDNSTSISSQRFHGVNPAGRLLGLISHKPAPTVVIRKQNEYFSQILRPVDSSNQQ